MNTILYIITPILSLTLALILMYPLRTFAIKINLVDKPNARKIHKNKIPLIGGILIVVSSGLSLILSINFWNNMQEYYILVIGSILLLFIGIIDDKMDVKAILKLIMQIAIAYFVFESGIKIDSLYGVFGIYQLPITVQYLLTLLIIVGVVNAFNLMDGIDGLAAGLAIVGLSAYTYIAILTSNYFLALIFISVIGALIGFLRYNLSTKNKIFMGDAGSLVLGYLLVVSGITLIQSAKSTTNISVTLAVVIGVLILPVADSIRVYRRRIKNGNSPFDPDKTHIHHLMLLYNIKHKTASLMITLFSISLLTLSVVFGSIFSITITILSVLILFAIASSILVINKEIKVWKEKLLKLENQ